MKEGGNSKTMPVLKTEIVSKVREVGHLLFQDWMSRADAGRMVWHFDPTSHRYNKKELNTMARALQIPTKDRSKRGFNFSNTEKRRHIEIEDEDEIDDEEEREHRNFPTQLDAYTPTTIHNERHQITICNTS